MVVGAPLTAAFARRWPPRRGLPAFVLVFAVVQVAGALADHLWVLVVTRVVAAFMATAALVNAGTCGAFTFLAPLITGPVGLSRRWIPVALMLFGLGSCLGLTAAGRLADRWPGQVVAVGGPPALLGRLATAATTHPATLLVLVAGQGALSFAVGSTLVARVLGEAGRRRWAAPTPPRRSTSARRSARSPRRPRWVPGRPNAVRSWRPRSRSPRRRRPRRRPGCAPRTR
ncbi:MFS transporter [Nocardia farcinica]|uniref:hypothetical protein n=1 Tax=Nocardia farcinica TaxID=37329 RepID=UPI001895E02F|nr:hypothetical protein [Nocardia farcinica]MBF6382411.1 hypothetical protein [Nocardia farcinica]